MSCTDPPSTPASTKADYDIGVLKWEEQHMAENGGSGPVVVSTASPRVKHDPSSPLKDIHDDDEYYGDPNIDFDTEYLEDESPYPEVRSAVANTDDPDMPAGTLRAWTLGLLWAIIIPGVNQFFFFRFPNVTVGPLVAQLLTFPLGRLVARFLPQIRIFGMPLNPGPFSIKEHVVVTIMAGVGATSAYATDIIAVQRFYYHQVYNFGYQFMIVMSTQLIGFSIGGIAKRFLVSPPSMIWPSNLVYCALFNTLHAQWYIGVGKRGGMSRERFFYIAFTAAAVWFLVPGYLFTALSFFSWGCWIKPHDVLLNQIFGYQSGFGLSLITFDWAQVAFIGSPLATPWWAEGNVAFGFVVFFWFVTPLLYYTNVWDSQFMPILARDVFDNTGHPYVISNVMQNSVFSPELYHEYSPLFLPVAFVISYALSFASVTATIAHVYLYYRKQIVVQARRSLAEQPDIHARLMSQYPQVPEWWYLVIFVTMFVFGVIAIEIYPTEMPVWAFVLALAIAFVYTLPIGIIQAVTNQQIGLNVITELIIGYALPGRPLAMMLFKTWGYVTMSQALTFVSDMKLGHYMKIPPRTMFWCQVVATILAGLVQLAVQSWMFSNIPDMCSPHQDDGFICASTKVFYTASVIWGVVGPRSLFSSGQTYSFLRYFFLFGAVAPVIPYLLVKRYPNSVVRYVNIPIILNGTGWIPPANALNYVPWAIVGFISQYIVRRRHFGWWSKYNYVLSAALDAGTAIGAIFVFFILQYPGNGSIGKTSVEQWWGNTVWRNTADMRGVPFKTLEGSGRKHFGPDVW